MKDRKRTKHQGAARDVDAATLAHHNVLERQRERANRALRKRRRQKSGQ
jgi:hypothetical protein